MVETEAKVSSSDKSLSSKMSSSSSWSNLLATIATPENYTTAASSVLSHVGRMIGSLTASDSEVEALGPTQVNSWTKCDDLKCDDMIHFSVFRDDSLVSGPIYHVIYVPRFVSVFRSADQLKAEQRRDSFNRLARLMNALEKRSSSSSEFVRHLRSLRESLFNESTFDDIHHAAACGFADAICELCANADNPERGHHCRIVNEATADGRYPLHIAMDNEHEECLRTLLRYKASVCTQDTQLRNVVHYAAQKDHRILQLLSAAPTFGKAIDQVDDDGMTPLCLAIIAGQLENVELLLAHDCSTGPFPAGPLIAIVTMASHSPNLAKIVEAICRERPGWLSERINGNTTILHEKIDISLLYYVLEVSADTLDVSTKDGDGLSPLHCAVLRSDLSAAFALLSFDANQNAVDNNGNTPLHIAARQGPLIIAKLLLCFNARVDMQNSNGLTALEIAEKSSCPDGKEIADCIDLFANPRTRQSTPPGQLLTEYMQRKCIQKIEQIPSEERRRLWNVMSLDGGGIKGLVSLQILAHIENALGSPLINHFKWFAGTSTGAVIALSLARGDSMRTCQRLYMREKENVFGCAKPCPDETIERVLKKHFGESCLMSHIEHRRVMVTATLIATKLPTLKLFRNYCLPLSSKENTVMGFNHEMNDPIWLCARYSSSAPTYFLPKDGYMDGGLVSNNPTLDLLADIHRVNVASMHVGQKEYRLGCVLSIGTGRNPVEVVDAQFDFSTPFSLSQALSFARDIFHLKNIFVEQTTSSDGECVARARCWTHDRLIPFFRFSPRFSTPIRLDETRDDLIVDFLWDTEKYLRTSARNSVESLVEFLREL